MTRQTRRRNRHTSLSVAVATGVALAATVVGLTTSASVAAPAQAPVATVEPAITGTPIVGRTLGASTGTWGGSQPMTFAHHWVRCGAAGGLPDGSNCARIPSATGAMYELRNADVGFRLRVRVTATNGDGAATVASNPTSTIVAARPANTDRPSISGSLQLAARLQADRGTWTGEQPMTFAYRWLRCNSQGDNCNEIAGATDSDYVVQERDVERTLRVRVTARNDAGSTSARSPATGLIQQTGPSGVIVLPGGERSIPVASVPQDERLVVSQVVFSPNPVTSRDSPITVRIRVMDTRGFVVRDALVFVRATPRVTTGGDRLGTATDGWVSYQLMPNANFPLRTGYNVQFFVKAYRAGDPALAGVAAYRLVQVRTARG